MKIGILTFVGTQSQGACLQAYALNETIKELGYDSEVINYHCKKIDAVKSDKLILNGKSLKKRLGTLIKRPIYRNRFSKFENFEKKHLGLKEIVSREEMNSLYDKIIVGSDQVWNTEITGNDYTFFLDHISDKTKKLTYAASLGTDSFPSEIESKCFSFIDDFSSVNVREEQLKDYLSNNIKSKVSCVIDPTQLVSVDKWTELAGENKLIDGDYLLVHAPNQEKKEWDNIYTIAKKKNLQIIYLTNRIYRKENCKCLYSVSPTEYLNYIKNAKYIVTGSFHTLSFSLIFEKDFLCTDSMIKGRNSRISNLLATAGCEDRISSNASNIKYAEIDYVSVKKRLAETADDSKEIIKQMLK